MNPTTAPNLQTPPRAQRLVRDWASQYQRELLRMWQTNEFKQLPGLE